MNDSGEFSSINNLLSWENHRGWNNTLLDIVKKDDISTMKIKRLMPGVDALEKKVKVKPNTLYKLTFDYEVLTSYTMYGDLFGIIVFDGKSHWPTRTYGYRKEYSLAYHTISTEPEKKSVILYFITKSDSIILHMPLTAINDDQTPTFTFGNFVLKEEFFPPIIKDDKLRPARILVSGDEAIMKITLVSGENKDIHLTPGLNTISLPEEIKYLTFATPISKDGTSYPIVLADLGNVKVRDPKDLFKSCNMLLACYGIGISDNRGGAGDTSLYSTFYGCDRLTYVDKMNMFMVSHVTWVSFMCRKLKSIKLQNLGAKLRSLDLEPCAELDMDSITYMVDNSAVPDNSTCEVILAETLVQRIPSDLISRAARDKRVILKKRR
jgi:hypothetical protein